MAPSKRLRTGSPNADMGEYTDEKGEIYTIDPEWTTGEIVILSDDKAAWRVKRSVLQEASPVFRDLFASASSNTNEVNLPDATREILDIFVRTLCQRDPPQGLTISQTSSAIDILLKYECNDAARRILFPNVRNLEAETIFTAFTLASRLDDIMSACRILTQGFLWYTADPMPKEPSLCPNSGMRPWDTSDAASLNPAWVWALTLACVAVTAENATYERSEPEYLEPTGFLYWRNIIGNFMATLAK